jgi:two-component system, cell cycle sensor histidine kinase and response regulator CckA
MEPASNYRNPVPPDCCGSPSSADKEQIRRLLDAFPESAYLCDPDGLIIYYNDRAPEIWGRRPALNDPADRYCGSFSLRDGSGAPIRHEHCFMAVALRERRPQRGKEAIVERPDGTCRRVLCYATPWCDENGRLIGGVNVLVDITDHKQMETALHADRAVLLRREAVLAQAGKMAHFGAWEVEIRDEDRINLNPLHWSDETFRIFGFSPGAVHPTNELFFSLVHPEDRQCIVEAVARSKAERRPYEIEHRIRRCDGIERTVLEHAEWTFAPDGRPIRLVGAVQDITARKQAEEALRRSEQNFARLLDSIDGIVWEADARTMKFTFVSSQAERLLGYPVRRWIDDPNFWRDHLHPEDRDAAVNLCLEFTRRGETHAFDYRMIAADGRIVWLHDVVTVDMQHGRPQTIRGVMVDITRRKQAEEALRDSEQRHQALVKALPDLMFLLDGNGRYLDYQASNLEDLFVAPETFLGRTVSDIMPAPLAAMVMEKLAAVAASGGTETFEYMLPLKSGRRWFESRITPCGTGLFMALARDITEQKQMVAALHESEERLRLVARATLDAYYDWDVRTNLVWRNDGYQQMLGADDPVGPDLDWIVDRMHPDDRDWVMASVQSAFQRRESTWQAEYRLVRRTGDVIHVLDRGHIEYDAQGQPLRMLGAFTDLTERVRAEDVRKKLEVRLMQAQKMEAVGQLAGGVAHDFNNLLTIIAGYVDLLQSSLPADSPLQSSVQAIQDAGQRAAALTGQLLAFSRRAVLEPKVLDLNAVVRDTEMMLLRLLGADIRLTTHLEPRLATVQVDPGQWGQVLINLAVNARDAMPTGGRLTIETAHAAIDEEAAKTHPGIQPGRYVMLAISDTGHGMSADVRSHIFEPFFTTKEVGKGTGLGLAVVHGIVSQSGGFIDVISEPDVGTTFEIYLPAVDLDPVASEGESCTVGSLRGSETILLVEDEQAVLRIAQLALHSHGYHVLTAADGEAAFKNAVKFRGRIDLLLTDVVMPHLHGPELAGRLAPYAPNMKTLYTSGYTDDAVLRYGVSRESVAFLPKPYTPLALVRKVRQVLDQK